MDSNGRIFRKLSIIDLAIVLIIAAMVAGVVFRFGFAGAVANRDENTFVFTVRVDSVRYFTIPYHVTGEPVYDTWSGYQLGIVRDVRVEQAYATEFLQDGSVIRIPRPIDRVLYIDIETPGFIDDDGLMFTQDSYELRVGSNMMMLFRYVQVLGNVANIEVIS